MVQCMRLELRKAICSNWFLGSMAIGISLSLINIVQNVRIVKELTTLLSEALAEGVNLSSSYEGFSLFVQWLGTRYASAVNSIFYLIWPVLAAIPYGWSYSKDRLSGYYNQIVTRSNRRIYFYSKYIATFVSGGMVLSIPLLFDLLINALVCPFCVPDVTSSLSAVINVSFLSKLFYTYPWVYALIWCFLDFLWGGFSACMCFLAGTKIRLRVVIMLVPFICFVLADSLLAVFCSLIQVRQPFSPLALAQAATTTPNPGWAVLSVMGFLLFLTVGLGYWQVVKHELA